MLEAKRKNAGGPKQNDPGPPDTWARKMDTGIANMNEGEIKKMAMGMA
jgi:hypothetical protein